MKSSRIGSWCSPTRLSPLHRKSRIRHWDSFWILRTSMSPSVEANFKSCKIYLFWKRKFKEKHNCKFWLTKCLSVESPPPTGKSNIYNLNLEWPWLWHGLGLVYDLDLRHVKTKLNWCPSSQMSIFQGMTLTLTQWLWYFRYGQDALPWQKWSFYCSKGSAVYAILVTDLWHGSDYIGKITLILWQVNLCKLGLIMWSASDYPR